MKHTKGKWGVKQTGFKKTVVCGNMIIASDLYDENKSPSIDEVDANANLIALAPEMLSVLKEYVDARELDDPYYVKEMRTAVKTKDYRKSANILFMAIDIINKAGGK